MNAEVGLKMLLSELFKVQLRMEFLNFRDVSPTSGLICQWLSPVVLSVNVLGLPKAPSVYIGLVLLHLQQAFLIWPLFIIFLINFLILFYFFHHHVS